VDYHQSAGIFEEKNTNGSWRSSKNDFFFFSLIPTTYLLLRDCVTQSTKIGEKKRQNKQNHLINVVRNEIQNWRNEKAKEEGFQSPSASWSPRFCAGW